MIELSINGAPRQFPATLTVQQLAEALELIGKRFAVELNGEIVPKRLHAETTLNDGDRLELVVAVGGG
ncbi:sulfur carrier protein [Andreprevotia lacus DSM 23236]|uniref:Sulfur carrier protein n=1 Tax=Andreprevotia lacus DSM 23236 TaxID=1121001 RepID=A0A1W1XX98_9NEIS|nr:sulfur carrier protein ThiS [Andreprevotia lacus]SMC28556.1 sulfur carrier protein [Andreprevotia lacus DSM 23236]